MIGSITVKDVARKAEVSVGTVSRVFNNHSNVTEEIRERVLQAAIDLGYNRTVSQDSPHTNTRSMKEIGFLYFSPFVSDVVPSNPFWSRILESAEGEARKSTIKMTYRAIGQLAHEQQQLVSTIQDMKLSGILLVGPADRNSILLLKSLNIPIVLIDNHIPGISVDSVLCDNFEGARMAVNYLIAHGHRNIAFIGGPVDPGPRPIDKIYTIERRSAGYRTALLDAGLEVNYDLMEFCDLNARSGYDACRSLLKRGKDFSALFCANDEIAIGALKALRETGRQVPKEISLIGFDNLPMVEHLSPALTTIRVNIEAMGAIAVRRLQERANDPLSTCISSVLEVELIERESVSNLLIS